MLPLFRKIRWRLAANNQFFKYSRYAIGEIVLVVIGILIALYINNWNEERKNEKKILEILTEVQRDVLSSLESIERTILFQSTQDSLFLSILSDTLEVNDLIQHPELINPAGSGIETIIVTEGFEKLKSNQDDFPKKFIGLYDSIKSVFSFYESSMFIEKDYINEGSDYNKYLSENWKWNSKIYFDRERNEETLAYFINNPFHRNRVHRARYILDDHDWFGARLISYDIYKKIARFSGEDNLPEEYEYLLNASLDEYSGTYKWKDTTGTIDTRNREIKVIEGTLRYDRDNYVFLHIKKDSFANYYNNTLFFKRDSSDIIVGATRYYRGQLLELEKVD